MLPLDGAGLKLFTHEDAEFVAVGIADIGGVENRVHAFAHVWRTFVAAAIGERRAMSFTPTVE
ncbi:MAG: hypothetical protein ACXWLW_09790, partial [Rhizomicrobium sp.]